MINYIIRRIGYGVLPPVIQAIVFPSLGDEQQRDRPLPNANRLSVIA